MIQAQGTGTPPDTTTDEQPPAHRYGEFTYEYTAGGSARHGAPDAETEVTS